MTAASRRPTRSCRIGQVKLGGSAPVVVQSMTNTDTADVASTSRQIAELWRAGSELVRVTVNTAEAAAAIPRIVERLRHYQSLYGDDFRPAALLERLASEGKGFASLN